MNKIGWWLFKWLVIPLALLAVGFFLIGPMIGRGDKTVTVTSNAAPTQPDATTPDQSAPTTDSSTAQTDQANAADSPAANHTPPKVVVTVRRGGSFRPSSFADGISHRRSRRRRKRRSDNPAAAPAAPVDTGPPAADG